MKPHTRKAGSGKRVRIATTFTGAAACAFAFAPAATAGTGQPATVGPGHQAGIRPDGVDMGCPPGTGHWLHIAESTPDGGYCVGDRGAYALPSKIWVNEFCGGNNKGRFAGLNGNGSWVTVKFSPGNYYAWIKSGPIRAFSAYISSWHGTDACGPV
jgi:hypothetical protein